jgi:transcriptional regulator with XRE-family HTH domain
MPDRGARRSNRFQALAAARATELLRGFGEEVRRQREDAGVSQRALARLTGVDQADISRIEAGRAHPTIATCAALGAGLGSDLTLRLFPNTGPAIRDRHQASTVESLVRSLDRRWKSFPEVGVRHPVRGWIDLVVADRDTGDVVAAEVVSSIHRFEQLLRWAGAKAEALPSSSSWPFGVTAPRIGRLLVLRSTAANRTLSASFRSTLRAAYPGDPYQALAALAAESEWPGAAVLWAIDRRQGTVEIAASPTQRRT